MDETTAPAPGIRASDAEREQTAELLHQGAADGRLSLAELDERLAAAYAAQLRAELAPLVVDLPAPPRPGSTAPAPRSLDRWGHLALGVHAVLVAMLVVAVLTRWVAGGAVFFWPAFPIFWAVLSLVVHARVRRYGPPRRRFWPPA
ncbi:MAG TPA: DUF1707 domain-containing protein [Pseudonocardia sp.]|jgi:hypothetical protein|nr:DUF1707 domain-containing protein [Pseudonocardia sp.]